MKFATYILIIFLLIPLFTDSVQGSAKDANNSRLNYIRTCIDLLIQGKNLQIDEEKWAKTVDAYVGHDVDIRNLLIQQYEVLDKINNFYKPEIMPALFAIISTVEELNQKNKNWIKKGNLPLLDKNAEGWFENKFYKRLKTKRIQLGVMQTLLFSLAAVKKYSTSTAILLPQSVVNDPLSPDLMEFKRILYHELFHLMAEHKESTPANEVAAELFSIKALILLSSREQA